MTVVSEAAAIGHQPSPRTVPTSMGADTKGLCQLFQRILDLIGSGLPG